MLYFRGHQRYCRNFSTTASDHRMIGPSGDLIPPMIPMNLTLLISDRRARLSLSLLCDLCVFELTSLSDGVYHLDGGSYFGVVPKTLWSKKLQANEKNLVPSGLNSVL